MDGKLNAFDTWSVSLGSNALYYICYVISPTLIAFDILK